MPYELVDEIENKADKKTEGIKEVTICEVL